MTSAACMPPADPLGYKLALYGRGGIVGYTTIDAEDFPVASQYRWHIGQGYAIRTSRDGGRRSTMSLHRLVMGVQGARKGKVVDHINGDRLDNRKANLRLLDPEHNAQNMKAIGGHSRHRGVTFAHGLWAAQCGFQGRNVYLGSFDTEEEAARAAAIFRAQNLPFSREALDAELKNATPPTPRQAPPRASRFQGVQFLPTLNTPRKWRAYVNIGRQPAHIGLYATEEEAGAAAADARERLAAGESLASIKGADKRKPLAPKHGHPDVYPTGAGRWFAQIYANGRHHRVGTYDTLEEAAQAAADARERLARGEKARDPSAGRERPAQAGVALKSRFVGVSYRKDCGLWKAQISWRGRTRPLGLFATEEGAASARADAEAAIARGEAPPPPRNFTSRRRKKEDSHSWCRCL